MVWFSEGGLPRTIVTAWLIFAVMGICFLTAADPIRFDEPGEEASGSYLVSVVLTNTDCLPVEPNLNARAGRYSHPSLRVLLRTLPPFAAYPAGDGLVRLSAGVVTGIHHILIKDTILLKLRV